MFLEGDGSGGEPQECGACRNVIFGPPVVISDDPIAGTYCQPCGAMFEKHLRALRMLRQPFGS